jgi:hypothetical protein
MQQASIGDALIYMTRWLGMVLSALVVMAGIAAGLWWWDRWSYAGTLAIEQALSREALNQVDVLNRQINALRVQVATLGNNLNTCLAGVVENKREAER